MQLKKHTLNLREGDYDYLDSLYKSQGLPAAVVIRTIIARTVDHYRSQESKPDFVIGALDE